MAKATETTKSITLTPPIKGSPIAGTGALAYAAPREGHVHSGVDVAVPTGTDCIAPMDGLITSVDTTEGFSGGGIIHFEFTSDTGPIRKGAVIGWGHVDQTLVSPGPVKQGTVIGKSGEGDGGACVHFIYLPNGDSGGSQWDGIEPQLEEPQTGSDPTPIYEYLRTGKGTPGTGGEAPNGEVSVGEVSAGEIAAISRGSALAAYLNLPTLEISEESLALKGERSLMNDKPLMEFITEMCEASLRNFMSMPDGSFFAWLPDYFGGLTERTPYWEINDTEIISGTMELSDDALATHVYVVGDTGVIDQTIDPLEKIQSAGVVTVFNAFQADFITGYGSGNKKAAKEAPILASKEGAINFLERYGARPYYQEAPMIRSHYFEMFLAYQMFCLLWSQQFSTKFEFTFMPELFPGGIIAFPQHGIQCYVQEVRHEGSYEEGFRTIAELTAPAALGNSPEGIHDGMVRSEVFNPQTIQEYARNTGGNRGQGQERNLNRKSK
jgi:hypothetical protein